MDETPAFLRVRNGSRGLFYGCKIGKCTGSGGRMRKHRSNGTNLLFAEGLNGLCRSSHFEVVNEGEMGLLRGWVEEGAQLAGS